MSIPHPYTLEDAKKFINLASEGKKDRPRKEAHLGITLNDEVIGGIGYFNIDTFT